MEDAHIAIYPFLNIEGMGLFGVFDGHGGTSPLIQDPKWPILQSSISPSVWPITLISKQESMRKH